MAPSAVFACAYLGGLLALLPMVTQRGRYSLRALAFSIVIWPLVVLTWATRLAFGHPRP